MRACLTAIMSLCLVGGLASQAADAIVATRSTGAAKTQLLRVDLGSGAVTALGRFSQDTLAPLALGVDPLNGDLVLVLDLVVTSRVLRLAVRGTQVTVVRQLADVSGRVSAVVFYSDAIYVSSVGATGGIHRFARNGAKPTLVASLPHTSALFSAPPWSSYVWLAQSGQASPATDPGMRLLDVVTGKTLQGPFVFKGHKPATLTGISEIPTALFRHLFTDTSGQLLLGVMFATPTVLSVTPKLPPGATRALRMRSAFEAVVLGGSAHPYLHSTQAFSSTMVWKKLAGPLPGDPVAFDFLPQLAPLILEFGKPCSPSPQSKPTFGWTGLPKLGSTGFSLQVRAGSANAPIVFVLGASDQRWGPVPLPLQLPGACSLRCSLDFLLAMASNTTGYASVSLPIPNLPALLDRPLFAQWIELQPGPPPAFATSAAASIHIAK
jgi:hypothetical protein